MSIWQGAARRALAGAAAVACAAMLTGCGSKPAEPASGIRIVTSVYPLQFAAQKIAGADAQVTNLTPAGVEPHDLELSAQQVQTIADSTLTIYIGGLAQAVDDAAAQEAPAAFDARSALGASAIANDVHFWLDPTLLAEVGDAIAARLAALDPAHAGDYRANAARFASSMDAVDRGWRKAIRGCESRVFVTSHSSFNYLARRYGLHQHAVLGLNPDAEPTPSQLQSAVNVITSNKLTTVYKERLLDAKIATTIAKETGAKVAVLDPIEGDTAGVGYMVLMQENLAALVAGNRCRG